MPSFFYTLDQQTEHFDVGTPHLLRSRPISPTQPFNIFYDAAGSLLSNTVGLQEQSPKVEIPAIQKRLEELRRQLQDAAHKHLQQQQSELVNALE